MKIEIADRIIDLRNVVASELMQGPNSICEFGYGPFRVSLDTGQEISDLSGEAPDFS